MRGLATIVKYINDTIAENALVNARFSGHKLVGLTSQIPVTNSENETSDVKIAAFSERGEVIEDSVNYESVNSVLIYHRLFNTSNTPDDKDSFGHNQAQRRTFYLSMFVYVNKKKTEVEASDMELLLMMKMPQSLDTASLPDGHKSCFITTTGADFNQVGIWERELKKKNFTLEPEVVLFELKYQIECTYSRECINVLCCP